MPLDISRLQQIVEAYSERPCDDTVLITALHGEFMRLKNQVKRASAPQHGKPWTAEEEAHMMHMYMKEHDVKLVATALGRAPRSVQYRISKILIEEQRVTTITGLALKYQRTEREIVDAIDTLHRW